MHKSSPQKLASSARGFSLPEVAMAIGIIAVAFVSLLALLPAGLGSYRAAIDEANETWIMQSMHSMVQTTDFVHVPDLAYKVSKEIYYFDEEGKLTDTENNPTTDPVILRSRIYAVKLVVEKLYRPEDTSRDSSDQLMVHGLRIITVIAPYLDPKAMVDFKAVKDDSSLDELSGTTKVHTRTFYVARMDSQS